MLITYLNRPPPYTFCNYSPYRPLTMVPLPPTHKKPQVSNHYQKENARFRGRYQHLINEAYSSAISAAIRFTSS